MLNILQNAEDSICIKGGRIDISTDYKDRKVLIHMNDSGCGIAPELISKIFEPFFTTKPAVKGTGLGLFICHGIIKNHEGHIKVKSEPGKGTSITIILPEKGVV